METFIEKVTKSPVKPVNHKKKPESLKRTTHREYSADRERKPL